MPNSSFRVDIIYKEPPCPLIHGEIPVFHLVYALSYYIEKMGWKDVEVDAWSLISGNLCQ